MTTCKSVFILSLSTEPVIALINCSSSVQVRITLTPRQVTMRAEVEEAEGGISESTWVLLTNSEPPIIVIHGLHGSTYDERHTSTRSK